MFLLRLRFPASFSNVAQKHMSFMKTLHECDMDVTLKSPRHKSDPSIVG